MLWFLSIASKHGFVVESYRDEASGLLARNAESKMAITQVTLRPQLEFAGGKRPTAAEHDAMHRKAHEQCFIANSIKTEVRCEPTDVTA